ncbi:hypothetical protein O6P43_001381 [Quillaja saponaria]|uniref:Uncharacterized protein n=1 Tax=Quillaja saponaria TaxID=32244 RepID=A0AAD7VN58_QUISA|nr:hypothetical protein O6P43_001381 [Quillaja saponaria]
MRIVLESVSDSRKHCYAATVASSIGTTSRDIRQASSRIDCHLYRTDKSTDFVLISNAKYAFGACDS